MQEKFGSLSISALVLCCAACGTDTTGNGAPGTGSTVDSGISSVTAGTNDAGAGGTTAGGTTAGTTTAAGGTTAGTTTAGGTTAGTTTSTPDAGSVGATVDSGTTADAGPVAGGAFEKCVAALKPKCKYDEKETACSSITGPVTPLTNGMQWGPIELKQGPYGTFVEWNEGMKFANPKNASEDSCDVTARLFFEPEVTTADVLDLRGQDLTLYTVFRPACMKDGETYPVITWGNGTCGQSGGYSGLLATLASHGFVVFAANSRYTDAGNKEMLKALDFAKAANEDPMSVFYKKLDLSKVGAMGHSQGGSATAHAASDPRIKAVILWNGGTTAVKPFLAVSGDRDIAGLTPADMATAANGAAQPGAWLYYHKVLETGGIVTGHLTLMMQPERVIDPTVAWWKYMLNGDADAKKMFVGTDCGLCNKKADFEFGQHTLP